MLDLVLRSIRKAQPHFFHGRRPWPHFLQKVKNLIHQIQWNKKVLPTKTLNHHTELLSEHIYKLFKMGEDFRLKWNDHHSVFFSTAESLCHGDHLTDVTLSCGSREFSAHKLVLSICSSYFSQLFAPKPGAKKRPADSAAIVYLKDVDGRHMELLLNYMYRGEINVEESELMGLLATAKGLQIKGLTENDDSETPKEEPRGTPVRSVSRGGASTSNSGVKRPQPSSKNTHIPAPKKIKEESASSSNLHLEAANVSGAAGDHSAEVHEESDYQNAEYLDDTEDIADYSMEDNPGESMVYEGDPNNPGVSTLFPN